MDRIQLIDRFEEEYVNWCGTGEIPSVCDRDSAFLLELQRERLEKKGVRMRCGIRHYDRDPVEVSGREDHPGVYREVRSVERDLEFTGEDGTQFRLKGDQLMNEIVITDEEPDAVAGQPHRCPNCGAVSDVRSLLSGCSYCGTKFVMSDLFPVVNNFWFVRDESPETFNKREKKLRLWAEPSPSTR